jgi:hypothetical protein
MINIFIPQTYTPTKIELLRTELNKIALSGNEQCSNLTNNIQYIFDLIWNNQNFTAQEIFDSAGTSAYQLFYTSYKAIELVLSINADYIPPAPPLPYTINTDGTVTVIYPV